MKYSNKTPFHALNPSLYFIIDQRENEFSGNEYFWWTRIKAIASVTYVVHIVFQRKLKFNKINIFGMLIQFLCDRPNSINFLSWTYYWDLYNSFMIPQIWKTEKLHTTKKKWKNKNLQDPFIKSSNLVYWSHPTYLKPKERLYSTCVIELSVSDGLI